MTFIGSYDDCHYDEISLSGLHLQRMCGRQLCKSKLEDYLSFLNGSLFSPFGVY